MVANRMVSINQQMMKLYKLASFGGEKSNFITNSMDYFHFLFSSNVEIFKSDAFAFFNQKSDATSYNYVEDNEIIKSAIKLSLPKLMHKFSFYIKYDDINYLDYKLYTTFEENGFAISADYLKKIRVQELKLMTFKDKIKSKKNKLKIKLLINRTIQMNTVQSSVDLLAENSDILIFITGGGFIADLEKIAQFYLRRSI